MVGSAGDRNGLPLTGKLLNANMASDHHDRVDTAIDARCAL